MKQKSFYLPNMCAYRHSFQKLFRRLRSDSINGEIYGDENTKTLSSLAEHYQAVDLISDVGGSLAGGQNGDGCLQYKSDPCYMA